MLQQNVQIEGLSEFAEHETFDDTLPGSVITKFSVEAEDMPFLSGAAGHRVTKNFVHVSRTWELGRSSYRRRIKDEIMFDEESNKWVITKLANEMQSDIRKNPNEWNAFMKGSRAEDLGTPLLILFHHDPARVEFYRDAHIVTIEQLAGQNNSDIQVLGNGVRGDVEKAQAYIKRSREEVPVTALNFKLEEKDRQIDSLQSQLSDLTVKLNQLLTEDVEEKVAARKGRPKGSKNKVEDTENLARE